MGAEVAWGQDLGLGLGLANPKSEISSLFREFRVCLRA